MTMDAAHHAPSAPQTSPEASAERRQWLYSPIVDFLGLGGLSLIVMPLLAIFFPAEAEHKVFLVTLVLANFINHPHFAHSYQIFYRGFKSKAFGDAYPEGLRRRYLFAGLIVPVALAAYLALGMALGKPGWMTLTFNLMGFLVGWHYVKQGYGMLMVDAALKKSFFNDQEKKILRVNGYICWAFTWVLVNQQAASSDYFGLKTLAIAFPNWLGLALSVAVALSTLYTGAVLIQSYRQRPRTVLVNGLTAYLVTLYIWMVFSRINPLFILVIPALHSIQYLLVVYRFQLNVEKGQEDADTAPANAVAARFSPTRFALRFVRFLGIGFIAGFVGFFGLPIFLDNNVPYDPILGTTAFYFVFWIFINIHHYCLDNVMWRRENPETGKYLFAAR